MSSPANRRNLPHLGRNRYEVPRRPQSTRAGVAGGHPVLAHGLDDGWNIAVGVAQKFPSLAAPPRWSEQRTPLVVTTVQQDGQEQRVVDVAGIEQRRPIRHPEPHGSVRILGTKDADRLRHWACADALARTDPGWSSERD